MVNRSTLILILGMMVGGCGTSIPPRYVSMPGRFSVDLPATAKESEQSFPTTLGPVPAHIVLSEDRDRTVFGVTYADLPENLIQDRNHNAALDGSCSGMIAASGATLLEKRNVTFGDYPGREIRFDVHPAGMSEKAIGVARIYPVGPRIYQLLALGGESKFKDASARAFFESFRLDDGSTPAKSSAPTLVSVIETGWGTAEDPGGDCRIQVEGSAATIEVPATLRVLEPGGKDNTPKLMKPIAGEFRRRRQGRRQRRPGRFPRRGGKGSLYRSGTDPPDGDR